VVIHAAKNRDFVMSSSVPAPALISGEHFNTTEIPETFHQVQSHGKPGRFWHVLPMFP
jgi:hypothetical protein